MSRNISANGTIGHVIASKTFPVGFSLSAFATDAGGFENESLPIADVQSGANGDMVVWSKVSPQKISISVIPDSEEDENFTIILIANRPGLRKIPVGDIITLTLIRPNGKIISLSDGVMLEGNALPSISNEGRINTKVFKFAFREFSLN